MTQVKVKPLVWEVTDWSAGDGIKGENDCAWTAKTEFDWCEYTIDWHGRALFSIMLDSLKISNADTLQAAKAAAQKDYERRVLAALDLPDEQKGEA